MGTRRTVGDVGYPVGVRLTYATRRPCSTVSGRERAAPIAGHRQCRFGQDHPRGGARIRSGRSACRARWALPRTWLDSSGPVRVPSPGAPGHVGAGVGDRRQLHLDRRADPSGQGGSGHRPGSVSLAGHVQDHPPHAWTHDHPGRAVERQSRRVAVPADPRPGDQHCAVGLDAAQEIPRACCRRGATRASTGTTDGPVDITSPSTPIQTVPTQPGRAAHRGAPTVEIAKSVRPSSIPCLAEP